MPKDAKRVNFMPTKSTQPLESLHPTIASWLFDAWGLDIVGPLPKSSKGHVYGRQRFIITNNGTPFDNKLARSLYEKFDFKQHKSLTYNAPANGLTEAFNKTLCKFLNKVVAKNKKGWHEKISEALWAYQTTFRTATQATPLYLV
ncbi:uncharacterized protein [Nicotiana sylvestris]|uniref:uncharacterized protein n=1 Tax=Nicotiana sylvestris TaxID=4096 RepID=UPI00388CEB63